MKKVIVSLIFLLSFQLSSFAEGIKVYFSPRGGCMQAVIKEISKADESIDVAMYDLTSTAITQELIKAQKRGVTVRIILDKSQSKQVSSKSRYLIEKGLEVRFYSGSGLMHDKFAIIDDKVLLTGSFNWTLSADQKNEENLLIIKDYEIIKQYEKQFKNIYTNYTGQGINSTPIYHPKEHKYYQHSQAPVKFF